LKGKRKEGWVEIEIVRKQVLARYAKKPAKNANKEEGEEEEGGREGGRWVRKERVGQTRPA